MTLLELHADFTELKTELHHCRIALESVAQSLLRLTEIPAAPPIPEHPAGKEAIGNYAAALLDLEGEDAEGWRARMKAAGASDDQIERTLVEMFTRGLTDEEPTE